MSDRKKTSNMLLVNVPSDVKEIIEGYKKEKFKDCGCKVANSEAVFHLLRQTRIEIECLPVQPMRAPGK